MRDDKIEEAVFGRIAIAPFEKTIEWATQIGLNPCGCLLRIWKIPISYAAEYLNPSGPHKSRPGQGWGCPSVLNSPVRSMGRRNTYDNFDMWSGDNEEEIRTGWVYTGAKGRAVGTMAARRTNEVDRTGVRQALFEHFQTHSFDGRIYTG